MLGHQLGQRAVKRQLKQARAALCIDMKMFKQNGAPID